MIGGRIVEHVAIQCRAGRRCAGLYHIALHESKIYISHLCFPSFTNDIISKCCGPKGDTGAANVISVSDTNPFIFLSGKQSEDTSLTLTGKVILDVTSVTSSDSNFTATLTDVTESFINGERTTVINFKFTAPVTQNVTTSFTLTVNYKYLETA